MNPTKAQSIAKLAQWCVENSSETFDLFFQYDSHSGYIELIVYEDGYDSMSINDELFSIYIDEHESAYVEEWVDETITELNILLAESNERNSPENAAKLQADRDKKELARAKAVVARLEGK